MTIIIHIKDENAMAAGWLAQHLALSKHLVPVDGHSRDSWKAGAMLREQTVENEPPGGWGQMQIAVMIDS